MVQQNAHSGWMMQFAYGRPVIFSLLVILVAGLLTEIPLNPLFAPAMGEQGAEILKVLLVHTGTGLFLVWLLVRLGLAQDARFTPPRQWKAVWLAWPLAFAVLLNLSDLLEGTLVIDTSRPGLIALFALAALAIGFCEEVMARGVVLPLMLRRWGHTRRGIYAAALVSSALFGAAHIFNLLAGRRPPMSTLTQIGYSFFFGVLFAALFLRNRAIWPVIILHAAIDFAGGLDHLSPGGRDVAQMVHTDLTGALVGVAITLPFFIYGLWILRKVAPAAGPGGDAPLPSEAGGEVLTVRQWP